MNIKKVLFAFTTLATVFFAQSVAASSVYIGVCETSQACLLKNLRKSLPNRESVNLIQHKEEGLVYRYDTIFITDEFGRDIYFTKKMGAVPSEVNTVVNEIVYAADINRSFEADDYIKLSENLYPNINGGTPIYDSFLTGLPNLSFLNQFVTSVKNTIVVDGSLWQSLADVLSQAEIGISAGNEIFKVDGKLVFKPKSTFDFGVKQGGAIVVFNYKNGQIIPKTVVLIDADTFKPLLEVPIKDGVIDFSSILGNSITISSNTMTLWNNTFKTLHFAGPCDGGKCHVTINDN